MERKDTRGRLADVGFYTALAACVGIVGICAYSLFTPHETAEMAPLPVTPRSVAAEEVEPPIAESAAASAPIAQAKPPAPAPAMPEAPVEAEEPRVVVAPLQGEIVTAFAADHLLYNETLGDWRVHEGVDLAAEAGTEVLAACAGHVVSVTNDVLMGTSVVIDHADGYQTVYANLLPQSELIAGEDVSAGQIIGAVGAPAAAEAALPPHLHFAVTRDGVPVDPMVYLEG